MGGTTGQSITLANSIIGVGILAMPFCFQQCGVLLATLILLSMGLISRLCCYFLLKAAFLARRRNFEFLAFHVFGSAGKLAVEMGIIGFLMGTCIAYFVVVGELGPQIISKMFNINQSDILRTSIMVIVSLVCVLPLGLLRNVDSLSNVSAATIGFYICLVIKVVTEAATQLPSGDWHRRMELWKPSGVLQCVPIFSMALFCQTQLFEIFESLPSLSLEKMNVVTKNAINICTSVYFTLGVFGYIAFCSQDISGNILMSLSPTMASDVIKLGFVMSLAFSFPLIIFPCRASLYSFLYKKVHSSHHDHIINHSIPETTFRCMTVGIVAAALCVSLLIPNIELVLGLVGSTIGVLICVVFPAACFINVTFKNTNERILAKGVLILGLVIMVLGTYANLQAAETQIERYDERFITQEKIDKIVEDFFEKREKVEEHLLKPLPKEDSVPIDANKLNNNVKKDSEVQPPNPVPPNSNELKNPDNNNQLNLNAIETEKLGNDVLLPEKIKEDAADTVSDTHPKNLKTRLNEIKEANGNSNNVVENEEKPKEIPPVIDDSKSEKIKLIKQQQLIETMKQHGEEQKELMQEQKEILDEMIKNKKEINIEKPQESKPTNEQKSDSNNKHQQLIETIKQHGEEQKELMKEQKEILDEIKELKQNKDTDSNEAKKIAVESIKQIADMAIKSIGGVTEKPVGQPKEDKQADRLEKLTHEAVQEIAKKAVETIEAIQEIKEKPDGDKSVVDAAKVKIDNEKQQNKPAVIPNNLIAKDTIENQNIQNNGQNQNNPNPANVKRELQSDVVPALQVNNEIVKQDSGKVETKISAPIANAVANSNLDKVEVKNVAPLADNVLAKQNVNEMEAKPHSHSPDEPQSYKVGEDILVKNAENMLHQNIPLAVAMSDQAKLENDAIKEILNLNSRNNPIGKRIENGKILNENAIPKVANLARQKREVVDTQSLSIDKVDEKNCESNVPPIEDNSIDTLPKVNLNDALSRFPLDPNMHFGRSLKSYDETDKKR